MCNIKRGDRPGGRHERLDFELLHETGAGANFRHSIPMYCAPKPSALPPAPEIVVEDLIEASSAFGPVELTTLPGVAENVEFKLPAELSD
jgi:hypothetical protein